MQASFDWNALETRFLWAYDSAKESHSPTTLNADHFSAWLVRSGWIEVSTECGSPVKARAGQWLFAPARQRTQHMSPACELLSLAFVARWPDETPLFDNGLPMRVSAATCPQLEAEATPLARRLKNAGPIQFGARPFPLQLEVSRSTYFLIQADFLRWLSTFADLLEHQGLLDHAPASIDQRVIRARHLLTHWQSSIPPKLNNVARQLGMSRSTLERQFVRHTHKTPHEFLDNVRRERAQMMLQDSESSIKAIAISAGFTSLDQFSHWFKRRTSLSPRAYRASNSQKENDCK